MNQFATFVSADEVKQELLPLLHGKLVRQHLDFFKHLLQKDREVLRELLGVGAEMTSAVQHYNVMARLQRILNTVLGIQLFVSKVTTLAYDMATVLFLTKKNFEVMRMPLYCTAKSTTTSLQAARRKGTPAFTFA